MATKEVEKESGLHAILPSLIEWIICLRFFFSGFSKFQQGLSMCTAFFA